MHYYKFNIADWSLGTAHLSLVEEAVYFRLINFYYDSESPIPLETQSVFRRLRMASESVIAQQIIDEFFTKTDKGYIHERCDVLLKEYRKTAKNNRSNGAKGGRPKKDAACEETQPKPSGLSPVTEPEPTNNPNQEPETINQEPETTLKEIAPQADADLLAGLDDSTPDKQKKEVAPKFKPESLADEMPSPLCDWWLKWVDYRRARKLSTKEPTWRAQANNLSEWGKKGHDPCQAIKSSIDNGYAGLFEPKQQWGSKPTNGTAAKLTFTPTDYENGINPDGSF
jgi:uncharacterized protein YdaU (DUF1376 family)